MSEEPELSETKADRFRAAVEPHKEERREKLVKAWYEAAEREQREFADEKGETRVSRGMFKKLLKKAEWEATIQAGKKACLETLFSTPIGEILDALESDNPRMRELAVEAGLLDVAEEGMKKLGKDFKEKARNEADEDERQVAEWESQVTSGAIEAMEKRARENLHAGGGTPQESLVHEHVSNWAKALLKNPIALKGFVVACEARMAAVMKKEDLYDFREELKGKDEERCSKIEARLPEVFGDSKTAPEEVEKVREHLRILAKIGKEGNFRFDFAKLKILHGLTVDMEAMKATAESLNRIGGMLAFIAKENIPGRSKRERLTSLDQLRDYKALLFALIGEAYADQERARAMYLYSEAGAGAGVPKDEPMFRYIKGGPMPTWDASKIRPDEMWEIAEPVKRSSEEIMAERLEAAVRYKGGRWKQ